MWFIQTQWIEELVNYFYLFFCHIFMIILSVKDDTNDCSVISICILAIWWSMNCMHFKIKLFTINCMLWLRMEMECFCLKRVRCLIKFATYFGLKVVKRLWILLSSFLINCDVIGRFIRVISYFGVSNSLVMFMKLIFANIYSLNIRL